MSKDLLPPPPAPVCLTRSYLSRGVKGGTIIAEDVRDLETHRQKLLDPDDYRSYIDGCSACGRKKVHAHCFRVRTLRPASRREPVLSEDIRLYRCPAEGCGAVFTVLPAVIARHLWRRWETVEAVSSGKANAPRSTARRWLGRLATDAKQLVQTLFSLGRKLLGNDLFSSLSRVHTRSALIDVIAASGSVDPNGTFAGVSGWIHRLQPGFRLM